MSASESDSDSDCDYDSMISACVHGDLDLVKRQVSKGVDVIGDNCDAMKSLLETCRHGRCEILKYLITLGIDVNRTNADGETALHYSVADDQLECVKILLENGARLDIKYKEMTPVQLASVDGHADVVEYFVQLPLCPRAVKIEALELMGAHYINEKNNVQSAAHYWSWSLRERERAEPGDSVPPKTDEPHPGFGNKREFQTEQELASLAFSLDDMRMQSLIMRERIFGPERTSCNVSNRAMAYAEEGNFDRSIPLMSYVLDIEQNSKGVDYWTLKDFYSLINMFGTRMLNKNRYKHVMAVLTKTVDIIEHDMKPHLDQPWNCTTFHYALYPVMRSISILAQIQPTISEGERLQLRKVLSRFVHLSVRDEDGRTPLHLACIYQMVPYYNSLAVVQLLLEVGADPQAVTLTRETPLHSVATSGHHDQTQVIELLLNSGAHYDTCNADGKCFTELLASDNPFMFENPMKYVSLQCLSAKTLKRYAVPFESTVPTQISKFIKLH